MTGKIYYTTYSWQQTEFLIAATDHGICRIDFLLERPLDVVIDSLQKQLAAAFARKAEFFVELKSQFDSYFQGQLTNFDLPIDLQQGTSFQKSVWGQVAIIPFGTTMTYGQIAQKIGIPNAVRAVGAANGANPVPILIPCHRVVQSNGHLGGYGGGLKIKDALLRLEGAII
jgi:O-6-methylguanine DNA methyltransferase